MLLGAARRFVSASRPLAPPPLDKQLTAVASLLLGAAPSSARQLPFPAPAQALERTALGILSVYSRSAAALDCASSTAGPGNAAPAPAAARGIASLSLTDAAATLHQLRVVSSVSSALGCPVAPRVHSDPRFALLLQAASYHLSAGGAEGLAPRAASSTAPGTTSPLLALGELSRLLADLAALAPPPSATSTALLQQLCDAACLLLPRALAEAGPAPCNAPSVSILCAATHLWAAASAGRPAVPLALLDALAAHFAIQCHGGGSAPPGAAEALVEAAVLLSWWNALPPAAASPAAPAAAEGSFSGEGPAEPFQRFNSHLQALASCISSSLLQRPPGGSSPTGHHAAVRFAWQCLYLASASTTSASSSSAHLPSSATALLLRAALCTEAAGGVGVGVGVGGGGAAAAAGGGQQLFSGSARHAGLGGPCASFSMASLVAALELLCSPLFRDSQGAAAGEGAHRAFLLNRGALLKLLLEELTQRTSKYEEGYLEEVLGLRGSGGLLGSALEPGADIAVCEKKRLSLKRYTASSTSGSSSTSPMEQGSSTGGGGGGGAAAAGGFSSSVGSGGASGANGAAAPAQPPATPTGAFVTSPLGDAYALFLQESERALPHLPPLPPSHSLLFSATHSSVLHARGHAHAQARAHAHAAAPPLPLPHYALSPPALLQAMACALPLSALPLSTLTPSLASSPTLASAATRATRALGDLAILQGLAGESGARVEAALACVCAEGGLQHRGLYAALGKRLIGRASNRGVDPRLRTVPLCALVALLHCLCLAWEFDENAFAAGIQELQRRAGAGELRGGQGGRGREAKAGANGEGGEGEEGEGEEWEERGIWGERAEATWRAENSLGRKLFRVAGGGGSLVPSPDFLWSRGSRTDWEEDAAARQLQQQHQYQQHQHKHKATLSRGAPKSVWVDPEAEDTPPPSPSSFSFSSSSSSSQLLPWPEAQFRAERGRAMDATTAQRLHDVLITLGTVSPFAHFVWEVPKQLRREALEASPRRAPLALSAAQFFQQQHSFQVGPFAKSGPSLRSSQAAARQGPHFFFPPPSLDTLLSHCAQVLRRAIPSPLALSGSGGALAVAVEGEAPTPLPVASPPLLHWLFSGSSRKQAKGASQRVRRAGSAARPKNGVGEEEACEAFSPPNTAAFATHVQSYLSLVESPVVREAVEACRAEEEDGDTTNSPSSPSPLEGLFESLVQPLYVAECGLVVHLALPYHRVAIEYLGPGEGGAGQRSHAEVHVALCPAAGGGVDGDSPCTRAACGFRGLGC
jgi:hypothetical protein